MNITHVSAVASATSAAQLQALFQASFGIDPRTIQYSEGEQKQALSLLDRVTNPNPDTQVQQLCEDATIIPFGIGLTIDEAIALTQSNLPQKAKTSLMTSMEKWRTTPADFRSRGTFLTRTADKIEYPVTKDTLQQRQSVIDLGEKYTNKTLVFDIPRQKYIEIDYTDKDHTHPWEKISARVSSCVYFVNTQHPDIARVLRQAIVSSSPDYFQEKGQRLVPTELLKITLYNDTDNLTLLNSPDNSSKSATDVITWLNQKGQKTILQQLVIEVALDTNSKIADLIDQTGFIDRFKNDATVKEAHRGRGIGLGIVHCFDKNSHEQLKDFEIRRLKNYDLLHCMQYHAAEMENANMNVDDIKTVIQDFKDDFGKYNARARNTARNKFIEIATKQTYLGIQSPGPLDLSSDSGSDTEQRIKLLTQKVSIARAETQKERKEKLQERQRADQERQEKLQEKQRADQLAATVAQLQAQMAKNAKTHQSGNEE